jgi:peptidyl-prolyl cis-trans isomerase SurA
MNNRLFLLGSVLLILFNHLNALAVENKILFKIDYKIITSVDIYNEITYLKITNPNIKKLDDKKIFQIAKNSLIREKIKEIEVLKKIKKIDLNNEFLDKIIISYYSRLGVNSIKDFEVFFSTRDLNSKDIKKKIAIQSYWNNLIYNLYSDKVKINNESLKKQILDNAKEKSKSFFLSEIVFETSDKTTLDNKFQIINQSITQEGFENAALIHSISESAKIGGEIGWVNENSLNSNLKEKIMNLNINQHTDPIIIPGGFLILKINDIKEIEKKIDIKQELDKIVKKKTDEQLTNYSNIYFNKIKKSTQIENL